ncbi:MAG TPA: acyl-CoA thioesterase [Kofleriaceae bacterium]|nr:acyl-CoA thioesterase [Kofleriaceae bacterium]
MVDRFRFPITAQPSDIDENGHVSNLVYLRWVLETATAHSIALGWTHARYLESGNVWVVRRHELDYLLPVTAGQQLVGETWVDPWKAASCVRRTELIREGTVVARGATTWAFMSIASGRPQRIPDEMKALFS